MMFVLEGIKIHSAFVFLLHWHRIYRHLCLQHSDVIIVIFFSYYIDIVSIVASAYNTWM